jgi:hypothetical protein
MYRTVALTAGRDEQRADDPPAAEDTPPPLPAQHQPGSHRETQLGNWDSGFHRELARAVLRAVVAWWWGA